MMKVARGSLTLILSNLAGAALAFATSVVIARGLDAAGLGRWTFALAWASGVTMLSEFGLNTLLTREAARSKSQANQTLAGSLAAKLALCGALAGAVWLAAPRLGVDGESVAALRAAMLLAVVGAAYGSFTAVFRAFEWMGPILWLNTGGLGLQLAGVVWLLRGGGGVGQLVLFAGLAQALMLALAVGVWWVGARAQGGQVRVSPASVAGLKAVLGMLRAAAPFALAGAIGAIQLRSSPLLIAYLRGPADVGLFGAAWRIGEAAKLIPNGIFGAAFPALAAARANDPDGGLRLYGAFRRGMFALGIAMVLGLAALAAPLLSAAFGAAFIASASTLIWLGIGLLPNLVNGAMELYLYAAGDEAYATRLSALGAAVQVVVGAALIPSLGPSGAAMGVALGEAAIWLPLRRRMRAVVRA